MIENQLSVFTTKKWLGSRCKHIIEVLLEPKWSWQKVIYFCGSLIIESNTPNRNEIVTQIHKELSKCLTRLYICIKDR